MAGLFWQLALNFGFSPETWTYSGALVFAKKLHSGNTVAAHLIKSLCPSLTIRHMFETENLDQWRLGSQASYNRKLALPRVAPGLRRNYSSSFPVLSPFLHQALSRNNYG